MAHNREHRVVSLGNGRYRLFTIITTESIVSEEELTKLGITLPKSEYPWAENESRPTEWKRSATAQRDPDVDDAIAHWNQCVGGHDERLNSNIKSFLREFGLRRVKEAFDTVAINRSRASTQAKYKFLVDLFRVMRKGGDL